MKMTLEFFVVVIVTLAGFQLGKKYAEVSEKKKYAKELARAVVTIDSRCKEKLMMYFNQSED